MSSSASSSSVSTSSADDMSKILDYLRIFFKWDGVWTSYVTINGALALIAAIIMVSLYIPLLISRTRSIIATIVSIVLLVLLEGVILVFYLAVVQNSWWLCLIFLCVLIYVPILVAGFYVFLNLILSRRKITALISILGIPFSGLLLPYADVFLHIRYLAKKLKVWLRFGCYRDPLYYASKRGKVKSLIPMIEERGEDINIPPDFGKGASKECYIHFVVRECSTKVLKNVVECDIVDLNMKNGKTYTPLHIAILIDSPQKVKALLQYCTVDLKGGSKFQSPLMLAMRKVGTNLNAKKIAKILLEANADPTNPDENLNTPLHKICAKGEMGLARLAFQQTKYFDPDVIDARGRKPEENIMFVKHKREYKRMKDAYIGKVEEETLGDSTLMMDEIGNEPPPPPPPESPPPKQVERAVSSPNVQPQGTRTVQATLDLVIQYDQLVFHEVLGEGTFGIVYKGKYLGTVVAIKKLKNSKLQGDAENDFINEFKLMKTLRHPNIVLFMGICVRPPPFCIITEFCSRGSLYDYIHTRGESFSKKAIHAILTQTAQGMNYLHNKNPKIIHRDLKSANILLTENMDVKICDFGVSRMKFQSSTVQSTSTVGSPIWMAPEVILGKEYGEKVDVYSFAIIMAEMFEKKLPFVGLNAVEIMQRVAKDGMRPTVKHVPDKYSKLMKSCWNDDPGLRPSFTQILEILETIG